jgi:tryptophan-rich sensory protein
MVYSAAAGSYCNTAILSLMMHLSIGDIWNTINNVERRYGTSVLGIACVYLSAGFAAFQYSQVLPLAGKLLSLKLIWLTIASSLIIQTWRLNKNPETGEKYSLLPKTGEGSKTEFDWF